MFPWSESVAPRFGFEVRGTAKSRPGRYADRAGMAQIALGRGSPAGSLELRRKDAASNGCVAVVSRFALVKPVR